MNHTLKYIVIGLGYFGIGDTILEAAQNCNKVGGCPKTEKVLVKAVLNGKEVSVDGGGGICYKNILNDEGEYTDLGPARLIDLIKFIKLGALLLSSDPNKW